MSLKQKKMKITPRIKLNYNIDMYTQNITEQVNEWQATLYLNFIDFDKALTISMVKACSIRSPRKDCENSKNSL